MARSPLYRSLQLLAREHREAARLGIAPDELSTRRAGAGYSRREFLKRSGAVGAAVVAGPAAFARPARAGRGRSARIAIVGGGIAGLTAALRLKDAGFSSTVYESSSRIGGRMHSDRSGYWDRGQVSEFCGELIDTGHKTILGLAERFGLARVNLLRAEPHGSDETYYFDGGYYPKSQANRDFAPVYDALVADNDAAGYPTTYKSSTPAGRALDHMSVYDWIESRVPGGHTSRLGQLLDVAYTEEYGADTRDQSSLNLVYLLGGQENPDDFALFGASDERFHIAGGNERLPEAIAATLDDVRTGWRMISISANPDDTVTMAFDAPGGRQEVTADQVVLCMSFAVLRTLDYSQAGFDDRKQQAITQLGSGRNTKLQLQFVNRYWNKRGPWGLSNGTSFADTGYESTWDVTRGQSGTPGILVDYTGGSVAASFAPSTPYSNAADNPQVTAYAQSFLQQIEPVFPGISARWNGKATLSTPFRDPDLNLSYSYWRVGQYTAFSGYEGVPQGSIHFAGEHCSQDFQGYMEGGAAEGARAGKEVLARLLH